MMIHIKLITKIKIIPNIKEIFAIMSMVLFIS